MDTQEVKKILQIQTDKYDDYLGTVVPIMIDFAIDYCQNKRLDKNSLPSSVKLFVAKAAEFNMQQSGLKSRSMGDVSYVYNTDFPPSLMTYLAPYRKVRFI